MAMDFKITKQAATDPTTVMASGTSTIQYSQKIIIQNFSTVVTWLGEPLRLVRLLPDLYLELFSIHLCA